MVLCLLDTGIDHKTLNMDEKKLVRAQLLEAFKELD
jgi:hypothetical protein